jgi:hypothetical protein
MKYEHHHFEKSIDLQLDTHVVSHIQTGTMNETSSDYKQLLIQ